jgi:hypothetical protein
MSLLVLENFLFNIDICEYSFPYCGPSRPKGIMMWINVSESFHVNMSYFGSVIPGKKIFEWPHPILWLSLLWRKAGTLFEQFRIPFTQGWYIPSLIGICQHVLEIKILKKISVFLLFCYFLPLGKDLPLQLNYLEFSIPKDELFQVWLKLDKWFRRKSRKCKKFIDRRTVRGTDRQTTGELRRKIRQLNFSLVFIV